MKTLGERIKFAASLKGEDPTTIAEKLGCTRQAVVKIFNDEVKSTGYICPLSRILNCDPFWLFDGEGVPPGSKLRRDEIPLIEWTHLESAITDLESIITKDTVFKVKVGKGSSKTFALTMNDESMNSIAKPHSIAIGDIIYIDPERKPALLDIVLIVKTGGYRPIVRQYCADIEGEYFRPFNDGFRPSSIDDKTKIVGVVIAKSDEIVSSY